jgi:hypothetical protein
VPDGDILAWLREQTGTTGKVPGRRKVIDTWALGSPRADSRNDRNRPCSGSARPGNGGTCRRCQQPATNPLRRPVGETSVAFYTAADREQPEP